MRPLAMPRSQARPLTSVVADFEKVFAPDSTTARTPAPLTGRPLASETTVTRTAAVPFIGVTATPGGGGGGGGGSCATSAQLSRHQTSVMGDSGSNEPC